jgi:hypothetical protein
LILDVLMMCEIWKILIIHDLRQDAEKMAHQQREHVRLSTESIQLGFSKSTYPGASPFEWIFESKIDIVEQMSQSLQCRSLSVTYYWGSIVFTREDWFRDSPTKNRAPDLYWLLFYYQLRFDCNCRRIWIIGGIEFLLFLPIIASCSLLDATNVNRI